MMAAIDVALEGGPGARGYVAQERLFETRLHIKFTVAAGLLSSPLVSKRERIDELCGILRDVFVQVLTRGDLCRC